MTTPAAARIGQLTAALAEAEDGAAKVRADYDALVARIQLRIALLEAQAVRFERRGQGLTARRILAEAEELREVLTP